MNAHTRPSRLPIFARRLVTGWLPPCCKDAPCEDAPAHWHNLYEAGTWPPKHDIRRSANV